MKIVFLGTPEFAVPSLEILLSNGYDIAAVVTTPDKPAGRGMEISQSAVKRYAVHKNLKILQPENLLDENFLQQLKSMKADLFIVVAFRILPEEVFMMPSLGTFNLHASLLPQYRGAAPINRAIMNGEKESGVTTFFLKKDVDTGKIIFREKVLIGENETAGELHDKLMVVGAGMVLKTVRAIETGDVIQIDQKQLLIPGEPLKKAPKIFKNDCRINWNRTVKEISDFVRGLSPYPTAFTELCTENGDAQQLKIFTVNSENSLHPEEPGKIFSDEKNFIKIAAADGFIHLEEVQLSGKKRMNIIEFLRGFRISQYKTACKK